MTSQVIYVIECVCEISYEKLLKSEEFYLFETDVSFRIPKLILPAPLPQFQISRCAVINGFIYLLSYDGDMKRLEARNK